MTEGIWEAWAIKYGTIADRTRRQSFMGIDAHDAAPYPLDYFIWLLRSEGRTILVDTGFDEVEGARRNRAIFRQPREGLAMLGIDAGQIEEVILTHLHYDHAGTVGHFPRARFHLQEA